MSEANEGAAEAVTEDAAATTEATEDQTQAQGDEQSGDDAAAATDDPAPKPKKSAQERINELTAARREAERDRDFYREQALRAQQTQQPAREAQHEQPQEAERPDRADFADDFEYIEALTDWKAEKAAERLAAQSRQQEQARNARSTFETRAKTLFPEGEPAGLEAFRRIPELPVAVLEIVGDSDVGPKIAEHLGDNPAELRRLEGLSPIQQARELTRLENRLIAPTPAPKPPAKTATDAPEAPPQARGTGGRFTVAPDTDDFAAFEKQYSG